MTDKRAPTEEQQQCSLCGRVAEDVMFDFIGPDPNDMDGEHWGYVCGADEGCQVQRP